MATVKEQMMLKAIVDYTKNHTSFRNRHISHLSELARQDVNHYLKKWEGRGFVAKNPLASGEWILVDMPGLIADLIEPTDNTRIRHCKHELFDEDLLERLHNYTDSLAALRALREPTVAVKDMIEKYLNDAINELRNERTYMHRKSYSAGKARLVIQSNRDALERIGVDVDSILAKEETKTLSLVEDVETEEYVPQSKSEVSSIDEVKHQLLVTEKYIEQGLGTPEMIALRNKYIDQLVQLSKETM